MIRTAALCFGLGLALGGASQARQVEAAAETPAIHSHPGPSKAFRARLAREQKLHDLGWRLARANAPFCEGTVLSIGLELLDVASFRNPDAIRRELGLEHDIAVLAAASGSPAHSAGITSLEPVTHIDGFGVDWWDADEPLYWQRNEKAHQLIDTTLQLQGEVKLTRAGREAVTVAGQRVCPTRFELTGGDDIALADGTRVRLSAGYPAFDYPEDELAAVIAHELAHNVLGHRALLDAKGRKPSRVRATEREADRLAPWLLANAGFEPEAALRFMNRWGPEHGSGIFRKRTHQGWDERAEIIAAEIPLVRQALEDMGEADWHSRFRREVTE